MHRPRRLIFILALGSVLSLSVASGGRTQSFLAGAPIDGVRCDRSEGSKVHIHEHLSIYNHGSHILVPSLIGIPPTGDCLYWIHTHNDDGIIHVESPVYRPFTLGQFFDIWGQPLSWTLAAGAVSSRGSKLKIWINNKQFTGRNPRLLVIKNKTDLLIISGPTLRRLPPLTDWKALNM